MCRSRLSFQFLIIGQEEALRRMKTGLANARTQYGHLFTVKEETWTGNQLSFRISALAQETSGVLSVEDDHVRLEIILPWLLARIANNAQALIRDKGRLMLEKK